VKLLARRCPTCRQDFIPRKRHWEDPDRREECADCREAKGLRIENGRLVDSLEEMQENR
jgi:hypothetical protein